MGHLGWARSVLDMVFDGVADTIDFEARTLMGDRYVRLQTALELASDDIDGATASTSQPCARRPSNCAASTSELDRACAILAA